eukprot:TRINITY_DN9164_c0_g1_i3.p1 TRINITY_DN9164_c0_g1~~TRINITY_DN9164_c0_g1_i3.p1  ORF type:complete len:345 (-),score=36.90 TRINITY_DN9164_c0_g1_i3:300-1277(-)
MAMAVRSFRSALRQGKSTSPAQQVRALSSLKDTLAAQIPDKQKALKELKTKYGAVSLGEVTVDQCIGGARGVKCMLWETSLLDAQEGIRFRGYTIPELQKTLPTFKGPAGDGEPLPEALTWLLLTGEVPTKAQCDALTAEFHARSKLPEHVGALMRSLPKTMHPMTQFSMGLMACQTESKFAKAYADGVHKSKYWEYAYEDIIDLFAKIPDMLMASLRRTSLLIGPATSARCSAWTTRASRSSCACTSRSTPTTKVSGSASQLPRFDMVKLVVLCSACIDFVFNGRSELVASCLPRSADGTTNGLSSLAAWPNKRIDKTWKSHTQ